MGTQLSKVNAKVELLPPRIVIHSEGGAGKTTLGSNVQGVLMMPVEEGLGTLEVAHLERPTSYSDVMNAIAELHNDEHAHKALAIDTIDKVEPLVWDHTCQQKSGGSKSYANIEDFGYQKGYTFADPYWIDLFKALDVLRRARKMTTVILSHNERKVVEDPIIGPHNRIEPKLHKRANALLYEWADVVGFLEIEKVATDKEGKQGRATRTALATGQRILSLEDRGSFRAKNRYGLPAQIELPAPPENTYEPLRAEIKAAFARIAAKPEGKKEAA